MPFARVIIIRLLVKKSGMFRRGKISGERRVVVSYACQRVIARASAHLSESVGGVGIIIISQFVKPTLTKQDQKRLLSCQVFSLIQAACRLQVQNPLMASQQHPLPGAM